MDGRINLKRYRTNRAQAAAPSASQPAASTSTTRPLDSPRTLVPQFDVRRMPFKRPQSKAPVSQTPSSLVPAQSFKPAKARPPAPVPPTNPQPPTKNSTQPTTFPAANNVSLPTGHPPAMSSHLPPAQSLASPPLHITTLFAAIQDQQSSMLAHIANSDRSLRDLVAEVGKLIDNTKKNEEETKKREAKDKEKEEREKEYFKVLVLLAQRVDDVKKTVSGIESVVGVPKGQDAGKTTMFDRLQNIEMDVEEGLERLRDPEAAVIARDRRASILPPSPSSLSPKVPTVVRHEMAVSPIKASFSSRTVSTVAPQPSSAPKLTKVDASAQVIQKVTEPGSLCVSCSNKLHSPIKRISTMLHSVNDIDIDMDNVSPSPSKGKQVEKMDIQDDPDVRQLDDDYPDLSLESPNANMDIYEPNFATPSFSSTAPATQTDLATSTPAKSQPLPCKHSDRKNERLNVESESPPPAEPETATFSPVDWSKTSSLTVERSSRGTAAIPSTITQSRTKSYILPPLQEGTIAALRKEALVDPHPYPLESLALGDANGLVPGVAGASMEAAERMLSPESQGDVDDDLLQEPGFSKVQDIRRSESTRSIPLSAGRPTSQPKARARAVVLSAVKNVSMSTTSSSLTSLSSNRSSEDIKTPITLTKTPSTNQKAVVQSSTPLTIKPQAGHSPMPPGSHTPTFEEETTVMSMVMDAPPTSSAPTPPSKTLSQILLAARPVALETPDPKRSRLSNRSPSLGNEDVSNISLKKLQEWYRVQQTKMLNKQATASPEGLSDPRSPLSPLFTSPGLTPADVSLLSTPEDVVLACEKLPGPPPFLKKLVDSIKDDDVDVLPMSRQSSTKALSRSMGNPNPSPSSSRPAKRSLLSVEKKGQQSKAKTRIKKYKKISREPVTIELIDSEYEEDQPPLKRVKLRKTTTGPSSVNSNSKGRESLAVKPRSVGIVSPVKTPMKRLPRAATIVWPKIDEPVFDQFIECDSCDSWYHVGCVGVHPEDVRLSASEIYQCPACESGISKALTPIRNKRDTCARPTCICPRLTTSIKREATFVVESFVGMVNKVVGGRGRVVVYLVKWQGYDFEEATWEEEQAMRLPNPAFFIEKFEKQARKERLDITQCNSQAALLKCAVEAGWNTDGLFIKKDA